jgi:hypothetical protein
MTSKKAKSELMTYDFCGGRAMKGAKVVGKGRKMTVIENIPFISCNDLGQIYITYDL